MYKKNSTLILFLLSFICFYLSIIFELDYLNIAFIPIFILLHKKNSYVNNEQKFIKTFDKYNSSVILVSLIIFFVLILVIKTDRVYYGIFSSLILAISILKGTLQKK